MSFPYLIADSKRLLGGRKPIFLLTRKPTLNYGRRRSDFPGRRATDGQGAQEELCAALRQELNFIVSGGYHGMKRTPEQPTPLFRQSSICANRGVERPSDCTGCVLLHFVPPSHRSDRVPCYAIPLDAQGHTIAELANGSELAIEQKVASWLRAQLRDLRDDSHALTEKYFVALHGHGCGADADADSA
jgi:hypothetical protein